MHRIAFTGCVSWNVVLAVDIPLLHTLGKGKGKGKGKGEGKVHPCIGTEVLYRPYDP